MALSPTQLNTLRRISRHFDQGNPPPEPDNPALKFALAFMGCLTKEVSNLVHYHVEVFKGRKKIDFGGGCQNRDSIYQGPSTINEEPFSFKGPSAIQERSSGHGGPSVVHERPFGPSSLPTGRLLSDTCPCDLHEDFPSSSPSQ